MKKLVRAARRGIWMRRAARLRIGLLVAATSLPQVVGTAGAAPPTTESVVLFNTVCAQCHEMECSRRLSFSEAAPVTNAGDHMENYAGPLDGAKAAELFGLLEYTKNNCDYYSPAVPVPRDGVWSASALATLATPSRTAWFVPLGALPASTWTVELATSGNQAVELEVLTRGGSVIQERMAPGNSLRLAFSVADGGMPHFLRLRSREPMVVMGMTLVRAGPAKPGK